MPNDRKLTRLLQGKTVVSMTAHPGSCAIGLSDGATLTVTVEGTPMEPDALKGATLGRAYEQDGKLSLEATSPAGKALLTLTMPDPGSNIVLRDAAGTVQYLG